MKYLFFWVCGEVWDIFNIVFLMSCLLMSLFMWLDEIFLSIVVIFWLDYCVIKWYWNWWLRKLGGVMYF